jgi:hypothetical protein
MPEILFYELLTAERHERARLFRKIGTGENPMHLIAGTGFLFGKELENGRPANPVIDSDLLGIKWVFNEKLQDPEWIPEDHLQDIDEWRKHIQSRVVNFREKSAFVSHAFFPEIADVRGGQMNRIDPSIQSLTGNSARVKEIFAEIAFDNGHRTPDNFGPEWIGYRMLQSQLIWSLDHMARYGAGVVDAPMPRLENTYCDAEYAALAALSDAFLCSDENAARLFRLMAPDVYCGRDLIQ